MSCEESYLAIRRYLTDEREPYAPGTHGNTKRKIRKAAACYVVRNGTLYYQRRQKGLDEFTELEVVLQAGRRKELIVESHIVAGEEHLNQHHTWESISQKYWWRGILKQVKDYMRQCSQCQNRQDRRGLSEDRSGSRLVGRPGRPRRVTTLASDEEEEEEDEEMDLVTSIHHKTKSPRTVAKHELVFVDSKGVVKQYLPRHGQTMLDKLNQQRLNNQFCDITLLIEGEEHRAHKAVLAACSDYFNELFIEKGAVSSHEAVVDLSGFSKVSFLPLLEFAYTSNLCFNFCVMADVATLARHLLMAEVLQICESVHKKVEEQKLMVYQQGDIHTVVSSQPVPQQALNEDPGAYIMTIGSDGHAVVTHTGLAGTGDDLDSLSVMAHTAESFRGDLTSVVTQALGSEPEETMTVVGEAGSETVTLVTHSSQARVGESVTLFSPTGEAETMTVVTHSGQAGATESLAVVSACLALEEQQQQQLHDDGDDGDGDSLSMESGAFLISVDPGKVAPTEVVHLAVVPPVVQEDPTPQEEEEEETTTTSASAHQTVDPAPQAEPQPPAAPQPPKRKRGRPAKVKQEVIEEPESPVEEEEVVPEDVPRTHDPYKRRLRQRSMGEGGYVRLHMGLEDDREDKKGAQTPQRPSTPKRGRPAKRLVEEMEAAVAGMENVVQTETDGVLSPDGIVDGAPITEQPVGEGPEPGQGPAQPDGGSEVEGEHTCSECGLSFHRRYALIMHTLKHEKTRGYKCSLCNKEFQYAASLRAHLARHKHQKSQRPTLVRVPQPHGEEGLEVDGRAKGRTKREFVCDICGKTLPKLYSLRIHMLNHTGVRPHSCRVCGKTFAHKHSLKMHRALHDAAKQFHCLLCDKSFVSKRSLEEHTSIHTGTIYNIILRRQYSHRYNIQHYPQTSVFTQVQYTTLSSDVSIHTGTIYNIILRRQYSHRYNIQHYPQTSVFTQVQYTTLSSDVSIHTGTIYNIILRRQYSHRYNIQHYPQTSVFTQVQYNIILRRQYSHRYTTTLSSDASIHTGTIYNIILTPVFAQVQYTTLSSGASIRTGTIYNIILRRQYSHRDNIQHYPQAPVFAQGQYTTLSSGASIRTGTIYNIILRRQYSHRDNIQHYPQAPVFAQGQYTTLFSGASIRTGTIYNIILRRQYSHRDNIQHYPQAPVFAQGQYTTLSSGASIRTGTIYNIILTPAFTLWRPLSCRSRVVLRWPD
ncbi:zinc finger and BTB domain-containing protein 11 isoform X2 [Salmo salar]|uniref:Zinc finger and BTB domain-containing protein 11 isoform X2 n=1 Tax=Salmo salar TaxID=8030 RepID=A0ABM3D3P5_SALSA|nr:zinc finger and BTB domain-containing protein 11 isoform X2 [Salmo salar]